MELVKICNALANETRFQIVRALKDRTIGTCCDKIQYFEEGVSVSDVVATTNLAQSTVSRHLAVLEQAGIIVREKRGLWTCYLLNRDLMKEYCEEIRKSLCE